MISRYLIVVLILLLVMFGCAPKAPAPTPLVSEKLTPVTLTTPDSTDRPSPAESIPGRPSMSYCRKLRAMQIF